MQHSFEKYDDIEELEKSERRISREPNKGIGEEEYTEPECGVCMENYCGDKTVIASCEHVFFM